MRPYSWLPILLICAVFIGVYSYTYEEKIDPNGDNVVYYLLGKSLKKGTGFQREYQFAPKPETHFPPGYPVFISSILMLSEGVNMVKVANGALLLLSTVFAFLLAKQLFRDRLTPILIATSILLVPNVLRHSSIMMSEMLYMFMSILSVYLLLKIARNKRNARLILSIIFLVTTCYYIRSLGIALFAAIVVYLALKEKYRTAAVLSAAYLFLIMPWLWRGWQAGGGTYIQQAMMVNPYKPELGQMDLAKFVERIFTNMARYIHSEIPNALFGFSTTAPLEEPTFANWVFGFCLLLLMVIGAYKLVLLRKFIVAYIALYLCLVFGWPEVWYGSRFIIPIIPFMLVLAWSGIRFIVNMILNQYRIDGKYAQFGAMVLVFLLFGVAQAPSLEQLHSIAVQPYVEPMDRFIKAAEWAKNNTDQDALFCTRKGGLFHLFSDRTVTGYKHTANAEILIQNLADKEVDYIVVDQLGFSSNQRYLKPACLKYPEKLTLAFQVGKSNTWIASFHPEYGYSGEFLNDKRQGQGVLKWADGRCFEGRFENGQANGEGVMYLPNGNKIHATWVDNNIEGPMIQYDRTGEIIDSDQPESETKQP